MIQPNKFLYEILPSHVLNLVGDKNIKINAIKYDSRKVKHNELFVAMPGSNHDGANYIIEAIMHGANAIVTEKNIEFIFSKSNDYDIDFKNITFIQVANARRALSEIAMKFFDNPSEKINLIGVTGTKGKTTTTYFIQSILNNAFEQAIRIGTIEYDMCYKKIKPQNTTPESLDLESLLYDAAQNNIKWGVMEVSSHALKTYRVEDISYVGAIFTNLSLEHTEFHPTMEDYYQTKKRLFFEINNKNKPLVINIDNEYGLRLYTEAKKHGLNAFSVGIENSRADFVAYDIVITENNQSYLFHDLQNKFVAKVTMNLLGRFNVYNSLLASALCKLLGVPWQYIEKGIASVRYVPGRFECVPNKLGINVIVDYAHTPESLENVIKTAKELTTNKMIVVFGCGGNRSKEKRPLMGIIAAKNTNVAIITSDNPRKENPLAIIDDIMSGINSLSQCDKKANIIVEPDRKKAIQHAISIAEKGDTILIAGKGHETGQIFADYTIPFDDKEVAYNFIKLREGANE